MAFIAPPVYTPDGLVAPWRLRIAVRIPAHLVQGTPAGGRLRLVVAGQAIAERSVAPRVEDGAYVLELDEWFTSIEWPQRKYIPVRDEAMENVTETTVDSGPFYTAVYAGGGGRICVADVCEDTDRDGDGIIEVVYLARPGERVTVHCEQPCTVRAWRAAMLSRLDAYIEAVLTDAEGAQLGSWRFPVQTLEAPVFAPEGFTIRIDPKIVGVAYPWCNIEHNGLPQPLGNAPLRATWYQYAGGPHGYVVEYEIDVENTEPTAPITRDSIVGGLSDLHTTGLLIAYVVRDTSVEQVYSPVWVLGANIRCPIRAAPSRIVVIGYTALFSSHAVVVTGLERGNVVPTAHWLQAPGRFNTPAGYTPRRTYTICPTAPAYESTTATVRPWQVLVVGRAAGGFKLRVSVAGRTIYTSDDMLIGSDACKGNAIIAYAYPYVIVADVRVACDDEPSVSYGAGIVMVEAQYPVIVTTDQPVGIAQGMIAHYCVPG